jgi:hypothetical protein
MRKPLEIPVPTAEEIVALGSDKKQREAVE